MSLYELYIPSGWDGHTLQELLPTTGCYPSALTRKGQAMLPKPDAKLLNEDILLVSATQEGIEALRSILNSR